MNRFIVITSIFDPTEAVKKFAAMDDHQLVVVGDRKTPQDWSCNGSTFLSVDDQMKMDCNLSHLLPFNHYCRKMMGYIYAIKQGADYIVDTDDDNIPKENWIFPENSGEFDSVDEKGFINIYELYTDAMVWPRGLPLKLIKEKHNLHEKLSKLSCKVGIWQGLADEDPDVDAIYRLVIDQPIYFNERPPVVLQRGAITPFNSQNTIFTKEFFPLLYLPTYVTFRFTDILRGLVAQPIMWLYDCYLGFTNATVIQKRNPHDYFKDFVSEVPMYLYTEDVITCVQEVIKTEQSVSENLHSAYQALHRQGIVEEKELLTLEAWLSDIIMLSI